MFRWDEVQRRGDGKVLLLYRHERVFTEGVVAPGMRVVDVGGWGVLAQRMLEDGIDCTILDLFTQDQYYPDRVRQLPHVVGDVCDAGVFPLKSLDAVTCFETLEHVADVALALRNIRGWLKPGGWLVGTVPLPGHIHAGDPTVHVPAQAELIQALKGAGFKKVTVEPTASVHIDGPKVSAYFKGKR